MSIVDNVKLGGRTWKTECVLSATERPRSYLAQCYGNCCEVQSNKGFETGRPPGARRSGGPRHTTPCPVRRPAARSGRQTGRASRGARRLSTVPVLSFVRLRARPRPTRSSLGQAGRDDIGS